MEPTDLCDDLVKFFDTHKEKQKKGTTLTGVDPNKKKTIDITIRPKDLELSGHEIFNSIYGNSMYGDAAWYAFLKKPCGDG